MVSQFRNGFRKSELGCRRQGRVCMVVSRVLQASGGTRVAFNVLPAGIGGLQSPGGDFLLSHRG